MFQKISSIKTSLNTKQETLTSTSNITTGTISSGNITGTTITASSNLLYGNNIDVGTKIEELETNKQDILTSISDLT